MAERRIQGDPWTLRPLSANDRDAALGVLFESLRDDPALRWSFFADRAGYEDRLRGYFAVGHDWHVGKDQPVQGAYVARELVGVLYAMEPGVTLTPEDAAFLETALATRCGREAAERFVRHNGSMDALFPDGESHTLALVGVRPEYQGRGIGSGLVEWIGATCDRHPTSERVILDAGLDANVRFYEQHGYEVIGELQFGNLRERAMIRPRVR